MAEPAFEPRRRARKESGGRGWLKLVLMWTLIAFVVLTPTLGLAAYLGWLPEPVVSAMARVIVGRQEGARVWDSSQPANILVMGLQIGGVSTNPLTDSMMVVSYQPSTDSVSMLSIPRDTWVEIPGHGQGRINEAFEDGGAQEALLTVQQNLGVPVNYYAIVSYSAFRKLIDDVGGITVDVPADINDPTFPAEDEIHFEPFHITKGVHHLDGREALRYARTRHADSDFGRANRQQQVLMALMEELKKPKNWLKAPVIIRDFRNSIRTNFPTDQAAFLGLQVLRAKKEGMNREVISSSNKAVQPYTTPGGASVLLPNKAVLQPMVEKLFGPSLSLLRAEGSVQVDNGNGYTGAAGGFTKVLKNMGVNVLEPGDADRKDYPTSIVRVYGSSSAAMAKAKLIAGMLGTTVEKGGGSFPADVQVILGRDYAPFVKFSAKDWQEAIKPK